MHDLSPQKFPGDSITCGRQESFSLRSLVILAVFGTGRIRRLQAAASCGHATRRIMRVHPDPHAAPAGPQLPWQRPLHAHLQGRVDVHLDPHRQLPAAATPPSGETQARASLSSCRASAPDHGAATGPRASGHRLSSGAGTRASQRKEGRQPQKISPSSQSSGEDVNHSFW